MSSAPVEEAASTSQPRTTRDTNTTCLAMAKSKGARRRSRSSLGSPPPAPSLRRPAKRPKSVSWKDEEIEGANVDMIDLADPAILMVGSAAPPQHRYTKEQLLKLRQAPPSQKRPEYLNPAYDNANGIWDPERWHYDQKTSEALQENGGRSNDSEGHRRRSGDPRERLRKEQDGIVLSPQRRSFNSGCFVPVREPSRSARSHSPLVGGSGKNETPHIGHREIPQGSGSRRIGSGRILPWDFQEKSDVDEFGYRRERREPDRERDERFERRSFGRDFETSRPKEKSAQRNGRYSERRRISENREEEPEWFSEGPVSQNDTIELRGFDDTEKITSKKKQTSSQKKKAKERKNLEPAQQQHHQQPIAEKEEAPKEKHGARSTPVQQETAAPMLTPLLSQSPIPERGGAGDVAEQKTEPNIVNDQGSFNLEDFLQGDTIPDLLTNGVSAEGGSVTGSKFSRWFTREQSPPMRIEDSRRSSLQDDHHHLIKNILNEISETNVTIPGDSDSYFAPISPAASTGGVASGPQSTTKPINLMEMLQRGKQHIPLHADGAPTVKNMEVPGKVLSLEELEARMLQGGSGDMGVNLGGHTKHSSKNEDDNAAFKRLLAQVSGEYVVPASNGPIPQKTQPMSILEMLTHSQQQDEAARIAQLMNSVNAPPPHIATDLTYKLQHTQTQQRHYDVFSKLINSGVRQQPRTTPPLPDMSITQSRELLNRPEAQAILQGLKRGDITPQHLYQQLANPAMQSRHRELLQTILKMQGSSGVGPSPKVLSPVPPPPPHPLFQQQQQQLRVSPLPPNAYCVSPILATSPNTLTVPAMHQRIPSPRELQVHTQNIMQRALIKKKLEEQQENYRKKQEMQQRGQSPGGGISPAKNVSSPTQLAFTPTSVLRKMTADKEEISKDSSKCADGQGKLPQGRAVTGMRAQASQQSPQQPSTQQQQQWSGQFTQLTKQPVGRPIVKNNGSFQQPQQHEQFMHQHQRLYNPQQQAQRKPTNGQQQFGGQFGPQQFPAGNQQFSQLTQHQLRAQHQQQHARGQQQQNFGQYQWQQLLHNQNFDNRRGGSSGGDMSPTTTNQLARWFSPEFLERARKGKLPNMPPSNLAQHALSLEEIERQTAPAVHN